jgi:hypothetical protein
MIDLQALVKAPATSELQLGVSLLCFFKGVILSWFTVAVFEAPLYEHYIALASMSLTEGSYECLGSSEIQAQKQNALVTVAH